MQKRNFYFIFHKPYQVLSQFTTQENKITLHKYFENLAKDVYPVGRLDYDSEGLLLLTNDKKVNEQLLHPDFLHSRTYWVQVEGIPTQEQLNSLQNGVEINVKGAHYQTLPIQAELLNDSANIPDRNPPIRYRANIPTSWIQLILNEGKNRQVRKMTAAIGFPTLRLIRYSIGDLTIDNLHPGEVVMLSEKTFKRKLGLME